MLNFEQRAQLCVYVGYGVDPEIAAKCLGVTWPELQEELRHNLDFAVELCQAEAKAEVNHVHNIQEAGKEKRHWRAAQWWLERRACERYGPRPASSITPRQFDDFFACIFDVISEEVASEEVRNRMLDRLMTIGEKFKAAVIPASLLIPRAGARKQVTENEKS